MPLDALVLALIAAAIHAGWNLVLSGVEDPEATTPVALAVGSVVLIPAAALTWEFDAAAWPYVAGSVALELAYFVLLARAYAVADLGFVYPIARGAGPVLVVVLSVLAIGVRPSVGELLGIAAVVAGILLVRGLHQPAATTDLLLALGVGACLAAYTVVDDRGVEHADPLPYLASVIVPCAAVLLVARGRRAFDALDRRAAIAGIGMVAAYAIGLAALARADPGPVAAVRETGVVMAVAYTAAAGRETVTRGRAAGALLVVAGIAALALT